MSEKTKILAKILSLYLVTSAAFLGYFFAQDYEMKRSALVAREVKNLEEIKMQIYVKAQDLGDAELAAFIEQKGADALVGENGRIALATSGFAGEPDGDFLSEDAGESEFVSGGRVGITGPLQNMEGEKGRLANAKISLLGKDISRDISNLKYRLALEALAALAALMAVAFWLARLALAPLYAQIRALGRFIKDSTHEINTPLSAIMMSAETMDRRELSERNAKRLANIELAAKTLERIYSNLVYLSFEQDARKSRCEVDMRALLSERLEYFAPFFERRNLRLVSNLNEASVSANAYEITKVVDNLLGNAVKYAPKGGEVAVLLRAGSLAVSNDGDGVPKELRERIFERYARFNTDKGGFGIGLALVRQICDKHGIRARCDSDEKSGKTTFWLEW